MACQDDCAVIARLLYKQERARLLLVWQQLVQWGKDVLCFVLQVSTIIRSKAFVASQFSFKHPCYLVTSCKFLNTRSLVIVVLFRFHSFQIRKSVRGLFSHSFRCCSGAVEKSGIFPLFLFVFRKFWGFVRFFFVLPKSSLGASFLNTVRKFWGLVKFVPHPRFPLGTFLTQ